MIECGDQFVAKSQKRLLVCFVSDYGGGAWLFWVLTSISGNYSARKTISSFPALFNGHDDAVGSVTAKYIFTLISFWHLNILPADSGFVSTVL